MGINLFQDKTKSIPKSSANIVRVSMKEDEIVARLGSMPKYDSSKADVAHVTSRGTDGGGQ